MEMKLELKIYMEFLRSPWYYEEHQTLMTLRSSGTLVLL